MTPLRRRMIEDLPIRGLAQNTIDSYVGTVERFARYFGRSPAELDREHIRAFQVHLVCERHISTGTRNFYTSALRFLYTITLGKDWDIRAIPYARTPKKLPEFTGPVLEGDFPKARVADVPDGFRGVDGTGRGLAQASGFAGEPDEGAGIQEQIHSKPSSLMPA